LNSELKLLHITSFRFTTIPKVLRELRHLKSQSCAGAPRNKLAGYSTEIKFSMRGYALRYVNPTVYTNILIILYYIILF